MDTVLGLLFWGGLLLLTLSWFARTGLTGRRSSSARSTAQPMPPPPTVSPRSAPDHRTRAADLQELREDEALADGLVIGHFLTRDHYRDRISGLEDHIDELTAERDQWLETAAAGDGLFDELDYAEFDAMGGFGVEPWAADLFDLDDED